LPVTIGTPHGQEGNDSGPASEFRSHLQLIYGIFQAQKDHGARGRNLKHRFTESQEMAVVCARRREMASEVKGALGFGLTPLFIAAGAIWVVTIHSASPEITRCTNGPQ
jgi:hypothetical protein